MNVLNSHCSFNGTRTIGCDPPEGTSARVAVTIDGMGSASADEKSQETMTAAMGKSSLIMSNQPEARKDSVWKTTLDLECLQALMLQFFLSPLRRVYPIPSSLGITGSSAGLDIHLLLTYYAD